MKRLIPFTLALVLLFGAAGAQAQDPITIEGELDVDSGSPLMDLAEGVPIIVEIVKIGGLYLQGETNDATLNRQMKVVADQIRPGMPAKGGVLVRVNLYVDEHGVSTIPAGQLLTVIGPGQNPVDALAEDIRMRNGRWEPTVPGGLRDSSSFFFVRLVDGKLVGQAYSRDVSKVMKTMARKESDRRRQLDWYYAASSDAGLSRAIVNAQYWVEIEKGRLKDIADEATREKIRGWTRRMVELQDRTNELQVKYERLQREIAAAQEKALVLEKAGAFADLVNSAVNLDSALAADGTAVKQTPKEGDVPFQNRDAQVQFLSNQVQSGKVTLEIEKTTILRYRTDLDALDLTLQKTYSAEGVPLPARP